MCYIKKHRCNWRIFIQLYPMFDGGNGVANIPTADVQPDGTFRMGINFLLDRMLPDPSYLTLKM